MSLETTAKRALEALNELIPLVEGHMDPLSPKESQLLSFIAKRCQDIKDHLVSYSIYTSHEDPLLKSSYARLQQLYHGISPNMPEHYPSLLGQTKKNYFCCLPQSVLLDTFGFLNSAELARMALTSAIFQESSPLLSLVEISAKFNCSNFFPDSSIANSLPIKPFPRESWVQLLHFLERQRDEITIFNTRVSTKDCHTLYIDDCSQVWGCGNPCDGQLGLGDEYTDGEICSFKQIQNLPQEEKAAQVAVGWKHSMIRMNSGKLFSFGKGEEGQLGLDRECAEVSAVSMPNHNNSFTVCVPVCISSLSKYKVTWVSCGPSHSLIVTSDGNAWSFGCGQFGKLGNGEEDGSIHIPTQIKALKEKFIVSTAAGDSHSLFLSKEGSVYSCGLSFDGQLGCVRFQKQRGRLAICIPTLIEETQRERVVQIAASSNASFYVTHSKQAFLFGHVIYRHQVEHFFQPTIIKVETTGPDFENINNEERNGIVRIKASRSHTILLTESNRVFVIGNGDRGILPVRAKINPWNIRLPLPVDTQLATNEKVVDIEAGVAHSFFLTERGQLWASGSNNRGVLGLGNCRDVTVPLTKTVLEHEREN